MVNMSVENVIIKKRRVFFKMITLTVILSDNNEINHYLTTNLTGYELFILIKELKQKKEIREVR